MKQHFPYSKFLGSSLILGLLLSCGVKNPDAKDQHSTQVPEPRWNNSKSVFAFTLNGANHVATEKDHQFEGSMSIWKEHADEKKMAIVLSNSEKTKIEKNAYLKERSVIPFLEEKKKKKKELLAKKIAESKEALKTNYYKDHATQLLQNSQNWAQTQIDAGKTKQFENFCDIELLRFASSDFLRDNAFSSKPEALGICHDHYKNAGMFQNKVCTSVTDTNPGNYFRCFWEDGVLHAFTLYNGTTKADAAKIAEFANDLEPLKVILRNVAKFNTSFKMMNLVWTGLKIKHNSLTTASLGALLGKGAKEFTGHAQSVSDIKGLTDLRLSQEVDTNLKRKYSFNDLLFNFHLLAQENQAPALFETDKGALRAFQEASPSLFGGVPCFNDPTVSERKSLEGKIAEYDDKIKAANDRAFKHDTMYKESHDLESANLIKDNNLAHALFGQMYLSMLPIEDLVAVKIQLDQKSSPILGCFQWASGQNKKCPGHDNDGMNAQLNKQSGLLILELTLKHPDDIGFRFQEKNDKNADFQLIETKSIENKTLRFELYPRQYGEYLDTLTGSIFIKSGSTTTYQGSVNLATKLTQ